jgi:hypothetical protein
MVKPKMSLELFDETGKSAGKFPSNLTRIYPGSAYRYRFNLPDSLPPKKYKALVIADCGENKVFGANLNINLELEEAVRGLSCHRPSRGDRLLVRPDLILKDLSSEAYELSPPGLVNVGLSIVNQGAALSDLRLDLRHPVHGPS